jgi:stage II sporulation protein D
MRNGFLALLVFFGSVSECFALRPIRVRVQKDIQSTRIRGENLKITFDDQSYSFSKTNQIQIERHLKEGKIFWAIRPQGQLNFILMDSGTLNIFGEHLYQGTIQLPSTLSFHSPSVKGTKFDILASLDLETYLKGVLPKEMPASWPKEALKAQAITARSYAEVRMREREYFAFDVEANVFDQAFEYFGMAAKNSRWGQKIATIVTETKGQVLVENSQVIKAFYHSHCGGKTELASNVWGHQKNFDGVIQECSHSSSSPHAWTFQMPKEKMISLLRRFLKVNSEFNFNVIEAGATSASGRVNEVLIKHLDKEFRVSSQSFRELIGFDKIKSTIFEVDSKEDSFVFSGRGNGHGVGMCQHGARHLALAGKNYREILLNYFPNTQISVLK